MMARLPPTFEARLVRAAALSPSVRELVFERVDGQPMTFDPGQWVSVLLGPEEGAGTTKAEEAEKKREADLGLKRDTELEMKRSYSIASAPDGSPRFEIAVTHVQNGPGSTRLHALQPGAVLRFVGPQGFFTRSPAALVVPSLMIATGTGVTPMRSMLRAAVAQGAGSRPAGASVAQGAGDAPATTWLILGVRHEDDLIYGDEFRALAREHSFFRFEPTLSQPRGPWEGRRGYVQTHVRELWAELAARHEAPPHAYVCGLERMVGSVRDLLRKEMGLPRQQVPQRAVRLGLRGRFRRTAERRDGSSCRSSSLPPRSRRARSVR